jgi:hypothetical protein
VSFSFEARIATGSFETGIMTRSTEIRALRECADANEAPVTLRLELVVVT